MSDFPSDQQISEAWDEGLQIAQHELRFVGIRPEMENPNHDTDDWFYAPHHIQGATDIQIAAEMYRDDNEADVPNNDDIREFQMNVRADDDNFVHDQLGNNLTANLELRDHFAHLATAIENEENEDEDDEEEKHIKRSVTITVPEIGVVHKSTLVSKFNSSPDKLTWDRKIRVRHGKRNHTTTSSESSSSVRLFDDVGIYIKDRGKKSEWRIGRVVRIRNKQPNTVDYKNPVNIDDANKYPQLSFSINLYTKEGNSYIYPRNSQPVDFSIYNIIMTVSLEFDQGMYYLNEDDAKCLNEFLKNVNPRKPRNTTALSQTIPCPQSAVDGEGAIIVEIPAASPGTSLRSQRKRKQRIYQYT